MSITSDRPASHGEDSAACNRQADPGFPADSLPMSGGRAEATDLHASSGLHEVTSLPANPGLPAGTVPGSVAAALAMAEAGLGYLREPGAGSLVAGELGGVLEAMGVLSAKLAAARAAILSRFDAERAYAADGYGSSTAWLKARGRMTGKAAGAEARRMRQFRDHPVIAGAVASGAVSEWWAGELAEWTRKLPDDWRDDVDQLLVDTAEAGANLEDLAVVAQAAYEKWRQQSGPDGDEDDGFDDRFLKLGTTLDNAGRVTGDLTPECTAALQAVLESLGKKAGPEDERTEAQRYHDALQLACELLLRADLVPDRAGADTRVDAVIDLARLLDLPGAGELTEAWLAALAGQHGYLAGKDAEAAACDALVSPVVAGHPDIAVVDQMIDIILAYLDAGEDDQDAGEDDQDAGEDDQDGSPGEPGHAPAGSGSGGHGTGHQDAGSTRMAPGAAAGPRDHDAAGRPGATGRAAGRPAALSPQAWQALRYAIARLAVDLVSGPDRLASILRRSLLDTPYTSKSVILDVGYSATIPGSVRRAVQLRARHCEWPGCRKPPAHCDIHHLRHLSDGGDTSISNCVLICQFHHDICIHRWGWRLVLHPDATTTAHGPRGQVLHSHGPPAGGGPSGGGGPPRNGPHEGHAPPGTKAA